MTMKAELYFSYRSPYSYLGAKRYREMTEHHDLEIEVRPVFPIAIRDPEFFQRESPLWIPYLMNDIARVAEFTGQPLRPPRPDPIVIQKPPEGETRPRIAKDQPLIRPITFLGVEAARRGRGLAFAEAASATIWGGVENWNEPATLAETAARAGLDLEDMQAAIDRNEASYEAEVGANQAALEAAGHWGVPTLVFEGEPFFGQDRTELALWRMRGKGLKAR